MEFKIGFFIALLLLITLGIPFYLFSQIQSKKLKSLAFGYYVFLPLFIGSNFFKKAPEFLKPSLGFSIWFFILSIPIVFYFGYRERKIERMSFFELKKYAILMPYISAIAPIVAASCAYPFMVLFNDEASFSITVAGVYIATMTWIPAIIYLIIFMIFLSFKSRKIISPVLETPSPSELPLQSPHAQ